MKDEGQNRRMPTLYIVARIVARAALLHQED